MGEGLIEVSASLWRYGMRKMAARGSQVAAKGVTNFIPEGNWLITCSKEMVNL